MNVSLPSLRDEFPALRETIHGHRLVYLDNASTTQKPRVVLEAIQRTYESSYSNIHRGVHTLSQRATEAYESVREQVKEFLQAPREDEIIFTRGTTESINLVAQAYGRRNLNEGDEVLITEMEHHSNLVPWQQLCRERGATLRFIPIDDSGDLRVDELPSLLGDRTKIVALSHVSNSLGTVNPVREITAAAHAVGAIVLIDGAQAAPHHRINVQDIGCDFYAFSGHKVYAPSGVGVLWGRHALLDAMDPWQGGGDMILSVNFEETTYNDVPYKFEAGTPNIVGVVALGAALRWLGEVGVEAVEAHESALVQELAHALDHNPAVRRIGTPRVQRAAVSFLIGDIHPHDAGTILDYEGVAVRTGHHCTQPVMEHFDIDATVRASFGAYNDSSDVERLLTGLTRVEETFK
ncbi:MAG: cysteine desulfurase [Myxococcota bacterium]